MVPVIDRLLAKVVLEPGSLSTDCWIPTVATNAKGYTTVYSGGRNLRGHRVTYEHFVGPIPEGLQIDHLCRERRCVNPAHLEAVTSVENSRRGTHPMSQALRTGLCIHGHSLADARIERGRRKCRQCRNARDRRRWHEVHHPTT